MTQDCRLAAEWYQKAANKGDIAGQLHLAVLYRDGGKGFERDMAQAAEWYRKAADQGDVSAQGMMGTLYSMGQGVEQNYVEAYYWLDLAAGGERAEAGTVCSLPADDGSPYHSG